MERFKSEKGQEYLVDKYNRQEDREILSAGNGLGFEITPNAGLLVPWGVTEVVVKQYNNMSGSYSDELECDVVGAPLCSINTKIKVQGCPLSLRRECVGLDSMGSIPVVRFGEVCASDHHKVKTITVQNNGPLDAVLSWQVMEVDSKTDLVPRISLKINPHPPTNPNDDGCSNEGAVKNGQGNHHDVVDVKIHLLHLTRHPVYSIHPPRQVIHGFHDATFTVTMKTPLDLGEYSARLVADAEWQYPRIGFKTMGIKGAGTDKRTMSAVRMEGRTTIIAPLLMIDKRRHSEAEGKQYLKFEVASREVERAHSLFLKGRGGGGGGGGLHPSMHRSFALTNPLTVPVTFTLNVPKPFRLLSANTAISCHPLASMASTRKFCIGPQVSTKWLLLLLLLLLQ